MKAFIIDDDPITLAMVSFILREEGIITEYALSPLTDEAIVELEEFNPDVIILDIYLNGESGFQVASDLRRKPLFHQTPIVAISGSHTIKDKLEAYSTGFIDYLEKPFTREQLVNAVKSYGYTREILKLCDKIMKGLPV